MYIEPNSPAHTAGLQAGDVIVACNGRHISSIDELQKFLTHEQIGMRLQLTILRRHQKLFVNIVPTESPHQSE